MFIKQIVSGLLISLLSGATIFADSNKLTSTKAISCDTVTGTAAITFTRDNGKTLAPTSEKLSELTYTNGLVALKDSKTFLAVQNNSLIRSLDVGCSWTTVGTLKSDGDYIPLKLVASLGERAYGWSESRDYLVRIDSTEITYLKSPVSAIHGVATDPVNADRVLIGGLGGLWESLDGGLNWNKVADLPSKSPEPLLYRVAFDPKDLNHILVGEATEGAYVSFDGGKSWKLSKGFDPVNGNANVFEFAISPVRGKIVWAMGINLTENLKNTTGEGRHIYLSKDGGLTFKPVVDRDSRVTIINQPVMAAHPTKSNILYFIFGTYFQDFGTDVYKYDSKTRKVKRTHNSYHDIDSILFSPEDPSLMYFGLENVVRNIP